MKTRTVRGVAKFGIALGSGPRGLGFESPHSDHQSRKLSQLTAFYFFIFYLI